MSVNNGPGGLTKKALLLLAMMVYVISPTNVVAGEGLAVGLIYPEMREPYRSVFASILAGIKDEVAIRELEIKSSNGISELSSWVSKHQIKTLVSLGSQGLEACGALPPDIHLLAGAVLTPPEVAQGCVVYGGIALAPAPDKLFERLKQLKPDAREVTVIYNVGLNDWLIQYARIAADRHKLRLNTLPVDSLAQAAQLYKDLLEKGIDSRHAIWLPQDPFSVDQNTILPVLLKESWDREFVVFSSNPAHVSRGVLFALYPDYQAMGRRLGRMAAELGSAETVKDSPIQPLNDVLIAVNLRTADHLKLNLSNNVKDAFDLTFPASR